MLGLLHDKINTIINITCISENGDGSFQIDYKDDQPTPDQQVQIDFLILNWPAEKLWITVRNQRDLLLSKCDWRVLPDVGNNREGWIIYRQSLRDIPNVQNDPNNIEWPAEPT